MSLDWTAIWGVIGPALAGLATFLATRKPNKAKLDAAVAQAKADGSAADAEGTLYRRLREDVDALSGDVKRLRAELDTERTHSRKLERHIYRLERLMRNAGIEPPELHEEDLKVGGTA